MHNRNEFNNFLLSWRPASILLHMGSHVIRHYVSCCFLQICYLSGTLISTQAAWSFDMIPVKPNPWILAWFPPMASGLGGSYTGLIGTVADRVPVRTCLQTCGNPYLWQNPALPPEPHSLPSHTWHSISPNGECPSVFSLAISVPSTVPGWDRHLMFDWWMNK